MIKFIRNIFKKGEFDFLNRVKYEPSDAPLSKKEIRDNVLHALYKQMGMQQKAQGIVFSLPVSEAAGLSQASDNNE